MGLWACYFLAAAYLHFRGALRFEPLPNLALALLLVVPLPAALAARSPWRLARHLAAAAAALALFWHESWLPPLPRTLRLLGETGGISPAYLARLLSGALHPLDAGVLLALLAACLLLARRIILSPLAFAAIAAVALLGGTGGRAGTAGEVERFFESESRRSVRFPERLGGADVDVVLVHVCSMSWDDLRAAGLSESAFFRRFDLLLTAFNSVSSYTNPSAIRLLRAACGQPRHRDLYREARPECYLLDALRRSGYATWAAVDNDAPSYRFAEDIRIHGHADPPMPLAGIPVLQVDFDGSPIHDDRAILARWLDARGRSPARLAALYLDVTTLHGGARPADDARWWTRSRTDLYRESAERLFASLESFFEALRATGRDTLVVLVPEHGMALRGTAFQPPDIREIPFPAITTVPVALKLVGPGLPLAPQRQATVSTPTSYLALSHLLASVLAAPRFGPEALSADVLARVPETRFVAENEASMVVRRGEEILWRDPKGDFAPLP